VWDTFVVKDLRNNGINVAPTIKGLPDKSPLPVKDEVQLTLHFWGDDQLWGGQCCGMCGI
jgi:hypothetical protein